MRKFLTIAAAILTGMAVFFMAPAVRAQPALPSAVPQIPNRDAWVATCVHLFLQTLASEDPGIQIFSTPGAVAMKVMVEIAPDGEVRWLRIRETSGRTSLDTAAIRALSQVRQVPPFSPDMPHRNIRIQLPIGTPLS
ncbi:TonB family protein [Paracoccus sp. T5]|uniref:TonB family protein n=1 Tax=Paracoccus sp. T5 TaxID=3402161 RepID=UPI003AE12E4E